MFVRAPIIWMQACLVSLAAAKKEASNKLPNPPEAMPAQANLPGVWKFVMICGIMRNKKGIVDKATAQSVMTSKFLAA